MRARGGARGRIDRGVQLSGKPYTNFARILDQLGFASDVQDTGVTFELASMFAIAGLGPQVRELLRLKFLQAQWNGRGDVSAEAVKLGLDRVFGISPSELAKWLDYGAAPTTGHSPLLSRDEDFFEHGSEWDASSSFAFRSGHKERDVDRVEISGTPRSKAYRLHNDIQNSLYAFLCVKLGAAKVGTEVPTGTGTTVDLVTRDRGAITFYEIKTASSIRTSIRQALPQLLEYAYWPPEIRAAELVIVSHLSITASAERYIELLREKYGLPLAYQQFDLEKGVLV